MEKLEYDNIENIKDLPSKALWVANSFSKIRDKLNELIEAFNKLNEEE
jgi:hypothetical protein